MALYGIDVAKLVGTITIFTILHVGIVTIFTTSDKGILIIFKICTLCMSTSFITNPHVMNVCLWACIALDAKEEDAIVP